MKRLQMSLTSLSIDDDGLRQSVSAFEGYDRLPVDNASRGAAFERSGSKVPNKESRGSIRIGEERQRRRRSGWEREWGGQC